MFWIAGSVILVSLRCSSPMKLGIHSAPDRMRTGSASGARSSTRPRTGSSTIIATNCSTASRGVVAVASADIARVQTSS